MYSYRSITIVLNRDRMKYFQFKKIILLKILEWSKTLKNLQYIRKNVSEVVKFVSFKFHSLTFSCNYDFLKFIFRCFSQLRKL